MKQKIRKRPVVDRAYIILAQGSSGEWYGLNEYMDVDRCETRYFSAMNEWNTFLFPEEGKARMKKTYKHLELWTDCGKTKLHPNSPNQYMYFWAREVAMAANRSHKYPKLKWKVYRIGSKHCPVKISGTAYCSNIVKGRYPSYVYIKKFD